MEYKPLRQAFFAITCSYEIMNSVTIARVTVAIFAKWTIWDLVLLIVVGSTIGLLIFLNWLPYDTAL